ncbi:MAG: energy-coupling factor ABC transporter permease, partial [Methanomassiliicoccales archaeon]
SIYKVNKKIDEKTVPMMAILAAGIFVAQMLNFPIFGGTTGHLIGAALATVLVGPYAAMIIITVILIIQCFVFGDGGLTALGLNITNMAVVGTLVSWSIYKIFPSKLEKAGVIAAAWFSVFFASFACAIELATSFAISVGAYGIEAMISLPSMLAYHAVIGIGEGIITGTIFMYLAKVAPETIMTRKPAEEAMS